MPNWRDTYRPARLWLIDGRILFLVLPTLMRFRWYTVTTTVAVSALLYYIEQRRDMNVVSALRMVRSWLAGPIRRGQPRAKLRWPVDYGRIR